MNEPRVIVCAQCGNSWNEPLFIHTCLAVPRVAESLDDLAVGMVMVSQAHDCETWEGPHELGHNFPVPSSQGWFDKRNVVILTDPPAPPAPDWLVPADTMEALREHVTRTYDGPPDRGLMLAARAVLDAATEIER